MFQEPDYVHNVSLKLSDVLADIGVDKRTVLKRRRAWLLIESIDKTDNILQDTKYSTYYLGSLSEGTTTLGLKSDSDRLCCYNEYNVIQDLEDWQPDVTNFLMIQDESVSPGYCLLQCLRNDAPLPNNHVCNECNVNCFRDRAGRILLRNSLFSDALPSVVGGGIKHGPACTQQRLGFHDVDFVGAIRCKSWPLQAKQWLDWQGVSQWPTDDMKRYCSNTGCFVVGVGSKGSQNEELEWRISTCFAERCLMFSLNITQIRCYVLMKMILKTYIKPHYEDTISSFMCKTVVLQLTANSQSSFWRENNLLVCLSYCLLVLYNYILNENCPHFIIPGNNLMAGHISSVSKPHILEILQYIINSKGTALLEIECDNLGKLLQLKLNRLCLVKVVHTVSDQLLHITARNVHYIIWQNLTSVRNSSDEITIRTLMKYLSKLVILFQCQGLDKTACTLLAPWLCTTLGSILASQNTEQYNGISEEALTWISLGLNTDVSSGKLKLASVFYCTGDVQKTETVLRDIERCYDPNIVETVCACHDYINKYKIRGFTAISDNHNEDVLQYATAFCVRFLRCEINCIPKELQYELFRSTEEDFAFRGKNDEWMDFALVDSLPYLYFLQYKTYSHLGRQDDTKNALSNLIRTIYQEPYLGHRETAMNLLGQCMEQENRPSAALRCYSVSLNLRGRNNAAKIHICRLLSTMINGQA